MKYIYLLLICFFCYAGFAQNAIVKGLVKDELSQQPIAHAVITITGANNFTDSTKDDGLFLIKNVPYGKYTIEIKEGTHSAYKEDIDINQPEVVIGSVGLAVAESEVERSERHDKVLSEEPAPNVTVSDNDLLNIGAQNIAGALAGTRDPFISTTAFVTSAARFRIRGYNPGEFDVFFNGVPINDVENGSVPSAAWGGLNTVMRNRNYSLGLGPSDFAFGGLGGSYYLDATASTQRKGLEVAYSNADRNYRERLMATWSSGILKSGWAVALSFSRRWAQQGYVPGTFYDSYSYYMSVDKHFGDNHILSLTAYGSPTKEGKDLATVQEAYNLAGSNYYNPGWGYQNGVMRNGYVNNTFQPMFILTHRWKIDEKSSLVTAASFSFGKRENTHIDWYNAKDPLPDYYQNLPSYIPDSTTQALAQQQWRQNVNLRQIDWDNLYAANRNNFVMVNNVNGIQGNNQLINQSLYILGDRVQDQKHFNLASTYNTKFNEHISLTAGVYYQFELSENYDQVADLLGGKYWLNLDQYAQLSYPGSNNAAQLNLKAPNQLLTVGDKYGYDYLYVNHKSVAWIQPKFHYGIFEAFVAAKFTGSSFWRNGLFQDGEFPTNSYGKSAVSDFFNYAFKAGVSLNFDHHSSLYGTGSYMTQPPNIADAFLSSETRNQLVENTVPSQQVYAAEGGYQYKSDIVNARATFYFAQRNNQLHNIAFFDDQLENDVNFAISGINSRNIGGEAMIEAKLYRGFSAQAIASVGRHFYTNNPTATVTDNDNATLLASGETIYEKGYNVGGGPQQVYSFGLKYSSPQYWFAELYFNYYGWSYVETNPARLTAQAVEGLTPGSTEWNAIVSQEQLPNAFTMDFFAGYSWLMNNQFQHMKGHKYYLVFSLNVANLTNNQHYIVNAYEQNSFNFSTNALTRYPTKYAYMYGTNYLFTVAFRMQ